MPDFYEYDSESFGNFSNNLPLGSYEIIVTDYCGYEKTLNFNIGTSVSFSITLYEIPTCNIGHSIVGISSTPFA